MYFDSKPCAVCGSDVRLEAATPPPTPSGDAPIGPPDGVVGDADPTVDTRICTNADCPTNAAGAGGGPTP